MTTTVPAPDPVPAAGLPEATDLPGRPVPAEHGDTVTGADRTGLLVAADRAVTACLEVAAGAAGLGVDRWRALAVLAGAPGLTMGELSVRLSVPAPTATRIVDQMVARGLVFRRSDDWDRRRVLVHVSREGHAALQRSEAALGEAGAPGGDAAGGDTAALLAALAATTGRSGTGA